MITNYTLSNGNGADTIDATLKGSDINLIKATGVRYKSGTGTVINYMPFPTDSTDSSPVVICIKIHNTFGLQVSWKNCETGDKFTVIAEYTKTT